MTDQQDQQQAPESERKKRPASQYYWGDWWKDKGLHSCSLTARGLWHEMNCLMHDGEPYGHLTLNGRPMTVAQLANQCRISASQCAKLLRELEDAGVPSRTPEGVIFSRRMVRDEAARNARAEGGKLGGEHGSKGAEYGSKGGRPKGSKGGSETPLDVGKKPPPSSSSSSSPSGIQEPPETYHHPAGGLDPGVADAVGDARPTQAGAVCRAMRQAGLSDTNPGHPRLLALLSAGATEAEFVGFVQAAIAKGAGFAWVLGAVEGERTRAAATAKSAHHEPMPAKPGKSQFIADREAQASRWIGTAKLPGMGGEVIDAQEAQHGAAPAIR